MRAARGWTLLASLLAAICLTSFVAPDAAWAARRRRAKNAIVEGKRRAKAGAAWSARGRCDRAIPELSAAFDALHDPVILFNRGECRRKLGDDAGAIADYEGYLVGLPRAPNRVQVEARIAELRAKSTPARAAAPAPVAAPEPPSLPPVPAPPVAIAEAPALPELRPARATAAPVLAAEASADDVRSESSSPTAWLVGLSLIALAAGGAAAWWFARRDPTDVPPSTLGGYRF